MLIDKEIIKLIKELEKEPNTKESENLIISNHEVLAALNQIIVYIE